MKNLSLKKCNIESFLKCHVRFSKLFHVCANIDVGVTNTSLYACYCMPASKGWLDKRNVNDKVCIFQVSKTARDVLILVHKF